MGSLGTSLLAWLLFPAAAYVLFVGVGLLAQRASGGPLPRPLLAPVGMAATVVLVMPLFWVGAGAWLATPVAVAAALAGFVLAGRDGARGLNPGWLGVAALAAYLLFIAPVVAAGGWTWTGYNFVNDTSVQFLLADHLAHHGMSDPLGPPEAPPQSTGLEHIRVYFDTGYPLGIHGLSATLRPLGIAPLEAVYQPLIALLAAMAALSLGWLLSRVTSVGIAALGGFMAVAANLVYHYGLQGSVKEIAMVAAMAATAAVAVVVISSPPGWRRGALLGVPVGASVLIYSTAALPYLGVVALAAGVAFVLRHRAALTRRDVLRIVGVGVLASVLMALPALSKLARFRDAAGDAFSDRHSLADELAHLLRPLKLSQVAGVWLDADYRVPVVGGNAPFNDAFIALVFVLAVVGLVHLLRRRELGILLYAVPAVVALAVVAPQVSPYADAKLLVLLTPAVVLIAFAGVGVVGSVSRVGAAALALVVSGVILWSDALAYHSVQLAPIERLQALEDIGERYEGEGLMLVNDFEQFAKYFMRDARDNVAAESVTPRPARRHLRLNYSVGKNLDVDQELPTYLTRFPWIVERKGADTSRPPANFRLDYENRFYTVWRRDAAVRVVAHEPFQSLFRGTGVPSCSEIEEFTAAARPGEEIAVSLRPPGERLDTAQEARIPLWGPHPFVGDALLPDSPGDVYTTPAFDGGMYRIWVAGSFGRDISVLLDGDEVARVSGVNTDGEWLDGGVVHVSAGSHTIGLRRGGGSLAPGDGYMGFLGPLVFQPVHPEDSLEWVKRRDIGRRLCGRALDWIARVRR